MACSIRCIEMHNRKEIRAGTCTRINFFCYFYDRNQIGPVFRLFGLRRRCSPIETPIAVITLTLILSSSSVAGAPDAAHCHLDTHPPYHLRTMSTSFIAPSPLSASTFVAAASQHKRNRCPVMQRRPTMNAADGASDNSVPEPKRPSPPPPTTKLDPSQHSSLRQMDKDLHCKHLKDATKVVHAGVHRDEWTTDPLKRSFVNPPVYHASTIVFPTMDSFRHAASDWPYTGLWYGRHGNPTTFALEEAFAAVENGGNACVTSSGVAAVNASLLAFLKTGDHVLITDACYDPSRSFCDRFLARFGVETTYYSPTDSAYSIVKLLRPNTKVVLVETPSSLSFELMDIPNIVRMVKEQNPDIKFVCDNTWGPTLFRPFDHGVDVSINAATKYISGHSDLMMGIAVTKPNDLELYRQVKASVAELGCPPGSDDVYLALRGLRTLSVRLKQHGESGIKIAKWLETRKEVKRVMHPALESHPQHHLYKEQFSGSCGLFGFQLVDGYSQKAVDYMLDNMSLFSMGFSWGGFESLLTQNFINKVRTVKLWEYGNGFGQTLRLHTGLEDVDDLINDLSAGFNRLNAYEN